VATPRQVGSTRRVEIFASGTDQGWLGAKQQWWFDSSFRDAFSIFDLDGFYDDPYFEKDHVPAEVVVRYVDYVLGYGERFLGRPVRSVLELGSGGGWFSEEFATRDIDLVAVEGTRAGHERTVRRIGPERALRHDLRRRLDLGRTFDVAACTEVAEHIEPPFASQLIDNLARHSDVVWFSFEAPGTNDAHYHHCNEQPEQFWINLFRFFGFDAARLSQSVQLALMDRGNHVFYRPALVAPEDVEPVGDRNEATTALGTARQLEPQWKQIARLLTPPIAYGMRERLLRLRNTS
jgi:hypothetical protein